MALHKIDEPVHPPRKPSWEIFTAAPHRMMFFSGAVQLVLPILFWVIELIGRYTSLWAPFELHVPTTWAHGFIMLYGVFSFFIFGFLMTVYPRWMNGEIISKDRYVSTWVWLSLGMALFEIGLFTNASLVVSGLAIFLFGWANGQWALYRVYKTAAALNKRYETILNIALSLGWIGAFCFLLWLVTDHWQFVNLSLRAGLWLFLLPILITVTHRMLPFFSSNVIPNYKVIHPRWSLPLMGLACSGHMLLETNQLFQWLFITDIPLAFLGFHHSLTWNIRGSMINRLLAVLHLAFLWLGIGMALLSLQSLYLLFTGELILGKGPMHALTIGFVASMLIAMSSRVTMGHSGRMLVLDSLSWALFLGLQLTALLRLLADLNATQSLAGLSLNVIASVAWLVCVGIWVRRYAPMYLHARIDGREG